MVDHVGSWNTWNSRVNGEWLPDLRTTPPGNCFRVRRSGVALMAYLCSACACPDEWNFIGSSEPLDGTIVAMDHLVAVTDAGGVLFEGYKDVSYSASPLRAIVWFAPWTDRWDHVVVGDGGSIYRLDATLGLDPAALDVTDDLYSVTFVDAARGLAVGDNGTMVRTEDQARTWAELDSPTSQNLRHVVALGDDFLVFSEDGQVFHVDSDDLIYQDDDPPPCTPAGAVSSRTCVAVAGGNCPLLVRNSNDWVEVPVPESIEKISALSFAHSFDRADSGLFAIGTTAGEVWVGTSDVGDGCPLEYSWHRVREGQGAPITALSLSEDGTILDFADAADDRATGQRMPSCLGE